MQVISADAVVSVYLNYDFIPVILRGYCRSIYGGSSKERCILPVFYEKPLIKASKTCTFRTKCNYFVMKLSNGRRFRHFWGTLFCNIYEHVNILLSSDESSRSYVITYYLQVTASQNR